ELTNQIFDLISALPLCEKLVQAFLGDFVGNTARISPYPRPSYGFCIGVCRNDPDRDLSNDLYRFHKRNGDRISFLAARTLGHPDTQRTIDFMPFDDFRKNPIL